MSRRFGSFDHARQARPKRKVLAAEDAKRLSKRAQKAIAASYVLSHMPVEARLLRGRLYMYGPKGDDEGTWARLTPMADSRDKFIMDAPNRNGWREVAQGSLSKMLRWIAEDDRGTFHGLGAIEIQAKLQTKIQTEKSSPAVDPATLVTLAGDEFVRADGGSPCTVGEVLHCFFGVPLDVARQPVIWYRRHRRPSVVEFDVKRKRVLVRFEQESFDGQRFGGTCLYAQVEGSWGAYGVKPSESDRIRTAEAWLVKKQWKGWV